MKKSAVRNDSGRLSFHSFMRRALAIMLCVMMLGGLSSHCAAAVAGSSDITADEARTSVAESIESNLLSEKVSDKELSLSTSEIISEKVNAADLKIDIAKPSVNFYSLSSSDQLSIHTRSLQEQGSKALKALRGSSYTYNLGISPEGSGTVLENFNSSTKLVTLTAVPYANCTFLCWTEYYYDTEAQAERERYITDGDPYSPVYTWVYTSGRVIIANFKKAGEYDIYDNSKYSTKGTLKVVSPDQDTFRPGQKITLRAYPNTNYRVAYIQYGLATGSGTSDDVEWTTISETDTATFTMPANDVWVRAVYYSTLPHSLTITTGSHGTATYNGSTSAGVVAGDSVSLTITPDTGYRTDLISGVPEGYDASTNTFVMPDWDVTIHVTFTTLPHFEITLYTNDSSLGSFVYGYKAETGYYVLGAYPKTNAVYFEGWFDYNTGELLSDEYIYQRRPTKDESILAKYSQGYFVVAASNNKNGTFEFYPYRDPKAQYPNRTCYKEGEEIKLVAIPDEGYILDGFYYAYQSDLSDVHRIDGDTVTAGTDTLVLLANFVKAYEVVVSSSDSNAGSAYGNGQYALYDIAKVTAVPKEGYEFVSWTNASGTVMSTNTDYEFYVYGDSYTFNLTANFRRIQKTVTWVDGNGSTLKSEKYNYGDIPSYTGSTPTKNATAQYNYTFNNTWSPEITAVTEDVTYTAQFNSELRKYTITWIDGNGDQLKSEQVSYGTVPSYTGATPTKNATAQHSYTFTGWSPAVVQVTKDATYTAQFTESTNTYAITWVDGNGKTIKVDQVAYGSMPSYTGDTPKKDATAQYTYTFTGWSPTITSVTKAATYTAQFNSTTNKYKIDWVDSDGTLLKSEQVAYGNTPSYNGTPTKQATSKYTYTFSGWSPTIAQVTKNATYTACYTETPVVYTITFVSEDKGKTSVVGSVSKGYGTPVTITFDDPERVGFIFTGWDTQIPQTMPDHDMTITAEWEMEPVYMTSANVEFKGLIRMRMAFLMTEELHSRDDVYVAYYKEDGTIAAKIPLKDGEYLKDQDGLKSYGYYCPVRAKEFADNLYIKVIGVDGNPVEYCLSSGSWSGTEYVYTTKMYADAVLASSSIKQTMKDVASAFLDYGAAANIRFADGSAGYSVSDKVTQVTWEEMGESASYDSAKAKAMGVKISLNLDFMEDNSLYVYFTLPGGKTVSDYTFTFKKNGTSNTVTPIAQGGNKYLVKVGNIAARKLAEFYDITITEKSNSANTFTVHVSALSYAKTLAKQYEGTTDPTKQKMLNLVKSLYMYWKAAAAHWGTN